MRPTRIEFTVALRHNCRYVLGFAAYRGKHRALSTYE